MSTGPVAGGPIARGRVQFLLARHAVYDGPSPFSREPVVVSRASPRSDLPASQARHLARQLEQAYPDWTGPHPAPEEPPVDGLVALGRCAARWALGLLTSERGTLSIAGACDAQDAGVLVWVEFHDAELAMQAIALAFDVLCSIANGDEGPGPKPPIDRRISHLQRLTLNRHPDYVTRVLIIAAKSSGIPYARMHAARKLWIYGQGARSLGFLEATPVTESLLGAMAGKDKALTNRLLSSLGYPVPAQRLAGSASDVLLAARTLRWPLVVKPTDSGKGSGVTAGIRNETDLLSAYEAAARQTRAAGVIVEEFVEGIDYRLLVVRGTLVSVLRRQAASVVGDGTSTLGELIESLRAQRELQLRTRHYLKPIVVNGPVLAHLDRQGLSLSSVPDPGRQISLRSNANISTGGVGTECLAITHPDVMALAQGIARNLAMHSAGIDYITTDIGRSWADTGGRIIEVNVTPGVEVHALESGSEAKFGNLVLGDTPGRIPSVLIVDDAPGIAEVESCLFGELRGQPGTGYAGPAGPRLGAVQPIGRDRSLRSQLRQLLCNRDCTRIIVACTPSLLMQHGLPLDRFDRCLIAEHCELPAPWQAVIGDACAEVHRLAHHATIAWP